MTSADGVVGFTQQGSSSPGLIPFPNEFCGGFFGVDGAASSTRLTSKQDLPFLFLEKMYLDHVKQSMLNTTSKAECVNILSRKAEYANISSSNPEYAKISPSKAESANISNAKTKYWHTLLNLIHVFNSSFPLLGFKVANSV